MTHICGEVEENSQEDICNAHGSELVLILTAASSSSSSWSGPAELDLWSATVTVDYAVEKKQKKSLYAPMSLSKTESKDLTFIIF